MAFLPGDHVHIAHFGKGIVREVRNGGRYLVEVKGSAMVVPESQLSVEQEGKRRRQIPAPRDSEATDALPSRDHAATSIDLHGKTVAEAEAAIDEFLNDALLAGLAEVRIIHGRSGGRIKHAAHARLKQLPSVRSFRVDPRNEGVTIVSL